MATTNLFTHPAFKDGAFTSNDRGVRRAAIAKAMRGIDLGAELGATVYVFWGGREGVEAGAAKPARDALERYREAIDFLCGYVRDQGYEMRFAIEPKPNEPRGDIFLPTVGHALHFISMLEHPEMVGVNPEVAHETMSGLSFVHGVSQALWAGKLFHIDLNAQRIGRFDQDYRFGAEDLKEAFLLVHLLETSGYDGPRHFDAHAYRNEDADGVWEFAAGCMRTYLALKAKSRAVRRLRRDPGGARGGVGRGARPAERRRLLGRGGQGGCSARTPTSTGSPHAATATNGSTSWSSTCCSARADAAGPLGNPLHRADQPAVPGRRRALGARRGSRDRRPRSRARGRVRRRSRNRARPRQLRGAARGPGGRGRLHPAAQLAARRVDGARARGRQARALREAAQPSARARSSARSTSPSAKGGC